MLSNPTPNNLHLRQRQHRRQNSTPTAFDPTKVPLLHQFQRPNSHRRGMSLDQRPRPRRHISPQETVSTTTNTGQQIHLQHTLREAQQQRLARPGQDSPQYSDFSEDENYIISPIGTPRRPTFDAGYSNCGEADLIAASYDLYNGPINTIIKVNPNSLGGSNGLRFHDNSTLSPSVYLDGFSFDDSSSQHNVEGYKIPQPRRISGGIANRVSKFENLSAEGLSRPVTPPNQYDSGYFPLTPADTPFTTTRFKTEGTPQHSPHQFLETLDTSMEETLKPIRRRSALVSVDMFQEMRPETGSGMSSPPNTAPIPTSSVFDSAPMPRSNYMNKNVDQFKQEMGYESSNYSPTSTSFSPRHTSQHSSPQFPQASLFNDSFENRPTFNVANSSPYLPRSENRGHGHSQSISPTRGTSMQRSDSISTINLEESLTETGITIDDIANFIEGPGPDNKWLCLYPNCKKRFGRKENIKSHVQTHLGDRQYQCPHCQKCFVRQHDLKRHAKIHSGVKPYPCLCGNSFARHDALTRHRQRGMCIGAFEGIVKKVVKRGRPRKARPDVDERREKSSRTRSKNRSMSSASSTSGYTDSTSGNSPPATFDGFDKAYFGDFSSNRYSGNQEGSVQESSQFTNVNYVSPQVTQSQSARSSSPLSTHSYQSNHASPANTPPSLSQCSSSPPPGSHYFDLEAASSSSEHGGDAADSNTNTSVRFSGISETDDIFLEDFSGGMNRMDQDMLVMSKFAEAFGASGNTNEMFGTLETDDVFFGSP